MKKHVLFTQVLLNESQILILDELDIRWANGRTQPEKRIRKYISSIFGNKIVLIATHVVSDVECIVKEIM